MRDSNPKTETLQISSFDRCGVKETNCAKRFCKMWYVAKA